MSGFKPADAALEGFRITRENPKTFAIWVGATFAVSVLSVIIDVLLPGSVREGLASISANETMTAKQFIDTLILISPVLVLGLIVQSIMAAAVYRLIFRHDDTRFGYLRLGADEFRLMALSVIYIFLTIGLMLAAVAGVGIVVAVVSLGGAAVATFATTAGVFAVIGIMVYVLVRLSLAPVATFVERRLAIFESWGLTRGYFWPLLGAYVLALACIAVIGLLILTIFSAVAGAIVLTSGGQLSDVKSVIQPQGTSLKSYLSIGIIAYTLISSVFSALYNAVIASPGAVAYRELHGTPPQPWAAQPEAG
jgi:hypothetical protein